MLAKITEPVTVFIDEIDSTLNLGFRDDFFAAIRAMYNARAHERSFDRLSFALLGVATPTDLIQDRERTPFNIGHRIDLKEFSFADARPLVAGLDAAYGGQGALILARIFHWTGGHPYLTQRLCQQAVDAQVESWDNAAVDGLVARTFLSDEGRKDPNLTFIQDRILRSPPGERRAMLQLYKQVYSGKRVVDDDRSLAQNRLELYGLIQVREQTLHVRNEIYQKVFDDRWIKAATPADPQQRIAIYAVVVALLVVGIIGAYFATRPNPTCATFIERFTDNPDNALRLNALAGLFDSGLNCRQDALQLFYGLDEDAQEQLFLELDNPGAIAGDLEAVVRSVYVTLDSSASGHDQLLLADMLRALERSGMPASDPLRQEIAAWLDGRRAHSAGEEEMAVTAYSTAIAVNRDHPVTHFDRAMAYAALAAYASALQDLDDAVRIAQSAPPTPTPTPSPTPTPQAPSTNMVAGTPATTQGVTATVSAAGAPTGTLTATSVVTTGVPPAKGGSTAEPTYSKRFLNPDNILLTVRQTVMDSPELYKAFAASGVEYTHLAKVDIKLLAAATPTGLNNATVVAIAREVVATGVASTATPVPQSQQGAGGALAAEDLAPPQEERITLPPNASSTMGRVADIWNRYGGLLTTVAAAQGIDPSVALAVVAAEGLRDGFGPDGRLRVRFENHIFYDQWGKNNQAEYFTYFKFDPNQPWQGHQWRSDPNGEWQDLHVDSQATEWQALALARQLDDTAALQSTSMGLTQIMGFNYSMMGYGDVQEMFTAFQRGERAQIEGLLDFIESRRLIDSLRQRDMRSFAAGYNGGGQADAYAAILDSYVAAFDQLRAPAAPAAQAEQLPVSEQAFAAGDFVLAQTDVDVYAAPGDASQQAASPQVSSAIVTIAQGRTLMITGPGAAAGGITWWPVKAIDSAGNVAIGWAAEKSGSGSTQLDPVPKLPGTNIPDKATASYLGLPFDGSYGMSQLFGENPSFYSKFSYDGVPLEGNPYLDFLTPAGTSILAVDEGTVLKTGFEDGGVGNYVLLQHRWGESLYTHLDSSAVEIGQTITKGQSIGVSGTTGAASGPFLGLGIRINPYERTDGWGGFSDPLPYFAPGSVVLPPYYAADVPAAAQ